MFLTSTFTKCMVCLQIKIPGQYSYWDGVYLLGRWLIGQAILTKSYINKSSIADLLARFCASAANLTLVLYILDFLKVMCRVA
jgi:hypothetical protein